MTLFQLMADVLFIGHSLVGPDLPGMVESTLRQMQRPQTVSAQIINGATLRFNLDHSAEAEGVDGVAELAKGKTGVLVLTEAVPLAPQLQWNDTPGQIATFAGLARAANPDTRVYLYETWPSRNSGTVNADPGDPGSTLPWRERLDADLPLWEGAARDAAQTAGPVGIIPAGQAMAQLSDAVAAGEVPGITSMDSFFSDDIHLSDRGLYYIALVQAAAIAGISPEGLPARLTRSWKSRDAVITDAQAAVLQRLAWQTVSGYAPDEGAVAVAPAPPPQAAAPEQAAPAAAAPPPGVLTSVTNPNLALGLNGISDWSVQQPFLDVMKTSREWTGHLPGQWGGWDHARLVEAGALDEDGWPKFIPPEISGLELIVLLDLPPDAAGLAGRYTLSHQGRGTLRIDGRGTNLTQTASGASFDFTPGAGGIFLTIVETDPEDPIRNITLVREDRAALLAQGQIFNPDWLARIRGVSTIRLMDWMRTNDSPLARVDDRPRPADYTYTRLGAPIEVMVALANELDANPWFTLPHLAEDGLARFYAAYVRDTLEPGLVAHVEYSNEVWNWQFAQAVWAEEQGRARWRRDSTWIQFYALRASQIAAIWAEEFGAAAPDRLVRIIATQTGWTGLEDQILDAPEILAEGLPAPATAFDAYAVTGYFSALLGGEEKAPVVRGWLEASAADARARAASDGLTGAAAETFVAAHRFDAAMPLALSELESGAVTGNDADSLGALLNRVLPHHAEVARRHGLRLMMYEGGTHVVAHGGASEDAALTDFFLYLNYSDGMAGLYDRLMQGWAALTPEPFNAFVDVATPGRWGSWGALRHLGDENPRWRVIAKGCLTC